ncbi:MAG TPA: hypothetical protein VNQ79_16630 [Blastocatellia bacterium]|nr:hypothetical protein [Blastocatellia bacterium]
MGFAVTAQQFGAFAQALSAVKKTSPTCTGTASLLSDISITGVLIFAT